MSDLRRYWGFLVFITFNFYRQLTIIIQLSSNTGLSGVRIRLQTTVSVFRVLNNTVLELIVVVESQGG